MKAIVELDGIVWDVKARYWHAYSEAVQEIGFARTDKTTFWRLIRIGASDGELVRDAKPRHLEAFREHFNRVLEGDDAIGRMTLHDEPADTLRLLREVDAGALATTGVNLDGRGKLLHAGGLSDKFPQPIVVSRPCAVGAATLSETANTLASGGPVVVLGATEPVIRAADEAGLIPIGIASGPCIGKRLAGCGARATFPHIEAYQLARQEGDADLEKVGLTMAPQRAPTPARPPVDRSTDRDRRRRDRMDRRRDV